MTALIKIKLFFSNKLSIFLILVIFFVYLILFIRFPFYIPAAVQPVKISYGPEIVLKSDKNIWVGNDTADSQPNNKTSIRHIVFGIGASSDMWHRRKSYIELWWRPDVMRGFVWLDKPLAGGKDHQNDSLLTHPPIKISSNTSHFNYAHSGGHRSAIRISRILSEMVNLGLPDVRWYVMGDDDTFFVTENLVRALAKLDPDQFYYVGSSSESHDQNIRLFSYNMAYGGGGFAISHALAKAVAKMQDGCIQRYPKLYGSDDRIHACMAELGVPLTKHAGFHQCDVVGSLFGLLTSHPVTPLVSLHHLDVVSPIFPGLNRVQALGRLALPTRLDSAALAQQSICYDTARNWTVSVSWGYAVQVFRALKPAREMEIPVRSFKNWYKNYDPKGYSFNTRPLSEDRCEAPAVYYLTKAVLDEKLRRTASEYLPHPIGNLRCDTWKKQDDPAVMVQRVEVHKTPDPNFWSKSPRRNCCRIIESPDKRGTLGIDVGPCTEDEFAGF
uniref:Uncharacterized protein n=1 Tax=Kalanchoe fedtschenkoi TaxID=63787 RepID=A0A7N0UKY1_KALFE